MKETRKASTIIRVKHINWCTLCKLVLLGKRKNTILTLIADANGRFIDEWSDMNVEHVEHVVAIPFDEVLEDEFFVDSDYQQKLEFGCIKTDAYLRTRKL